MPRENLLSLFKEFERYRHDIAVIQKRGYRREAWTYGRLAHKAKGRAAHLKARGVKTGEHVLLWGPNSGEWAAAFWGCLLRGAVAVPMDDGANMDFVLRVARNTKVRLIFTTRERAEPGFPALGPMVEVVDLDAADANPAPEESQNSKDYESFSDVPLTRAHVAEILFTSGTTSEPRGVVLTHGNFLANLQPLEEGIAAYGKYERWLHPLRFVTLVPLSHVFGQFMALFVPPLLGAGVAFERSASPQEIMRSIKRERATVLVAVPRMVEALRGGIEREVEARSRGKWFARTFGDAEGRKFLRRAWMFRRIHRRFGWKFWAFISGGAALAKRDEDFFKRLGYAVVQGYGMTETASLISLNHPFRATEGSIGKVLPGREFRLAEDGEILVRGENVSAGYWEAGQLRRAEEASWLHTGDIGELDGEGNLHFRGRKKNVMVTPAGLNIYPADLEAALRKQPAIRDCVVLPVERDGNTQPCAVLLVNSGAVPEDANSENVANPADHHAENVARAAVAAANATLAEYQRMHNWVSWPDADFPRTSTGKPRLAVISECVAKILNGTNPADAAKSQSPSGSESVEGLVSRFTHSGPGSTGRDGLESNLSLTSLDRVELMSALEDKFHVELDETAFSNARSVADVEALLKQPSARRAEYSYPRWAQTAAVRALRLLVYYAVVWPATRLLARPSFVGREHLRALQGPVLVVCNHVTRRADIGLILAALPRCYRDNLATAMGGETLLKMRHPPREWPVFKRVAYQTGYWLVTALFNVFPLPQRSGFRESFRFAGESADRGYSVLVFPEGEVTNDGKMAPFQGGIGLLSENLALPVVPMRLDGVWEMKRAHRRLARSGEVIVRIGAPATFPPGTNADEIAHTLQSLVQSL